MTRFVALLLTVLTGFSGLVYEVTWQKYLTTLLGSNSEATAAVLAIFLGGLSVGYALFGRMTARLVERAREANRPPRLLFFYAQVEGGIGVYALFFPLLFGWAQHVSLLVPSQTGVGFAVDVLLSMLLIGGPSVLMGATIPVLTLALAGSRERATRIHAWVYGFNTVGAFAGALGGAFFLIPRLGLDGTSVAMGCLNLAAAGTFLWLDQRGERVTPQLETEPAGAVSATGAVRFGGYAAVAMLSGFAMMTVQTTLNRLGALALGSSHFTFAVVVAVFVLCIAAGSLAVSSLRSVPRSLLVLSQWALVAILFALYWTIEDAPYYAHVVRSFFRSNAGAFYPYQLAAFTGIFVVLVVPIGLSGALLPLLFHHLRGELGGLGRVAGQLYSWNTVGSLVGALVGGYALFFWLDLHEIYRVAVAALAVAAAILTARVLTATALAAALGVLVPLALFFLPAWNPDRLASGTFRIRAPNEATYSGPEAFFATMKDRPPMIFHRDGPNATVSVSDGPAPPGFVNRSIFVNGKSDGNLIGDYATMALASLIPSLLSEELESAFVIGFGTGVSAGELAAIETVTRVDVAEISREVLNAAPLFDAGNLGAAAHPKVRLLRGDAYRTLLRRRQQYDVIVSEPSNPWTSGVEMLYSAEFLQAARSRLAPGGVYAQWLQLYSLDRETIELVLRTYTRVFPHVSIWYAQGFDLLLLGFESPERALDLGAIARRFERADIAAGFRRVGIFSLAAALAHEIVPLGTLHARPLEGPLHTLRHPILSDRAARAFFVGQRAAIPKYIEPENLRAGVPNSLLRRWARGRSPTEGRAIVEAAARETCAPAKMRPIECITMLAHWYHVDPESEALAELLDVARGDHRIAAAGDLQIDHLALIARLYRGHAFPPLEGPALLERAIGLTDLFESHYHYAVPFNRRVLSAAWENCASAECLRAKQAAIERLGPFPPLRTAEQ